MSSTERSRDHESVDATAAAAAVGIHRIALPSPFGPYDVSCYLVEDEPLTLVDVGANWASSVLYLERALNRLGHRIEDVQRIVLTHQHVDHMGAIEAVAARTSAEIVGSAPLGPWLADYVAEADRDTRYRLDLLARPRGPRAGPGRNRRGEPGRAGLGQRRDPRPRLGGR